MQAQKSKQIRFKEKRELNLYSIDGDVLSIKEFVRRNQDVLSDLERTFLEKEMKNYDEEICNIKTPLSRTAEYFNGKKITSAQRGGIRSAYIKGMKIKGCRPLDETFPYWKADRNFKLVVETIPFGVLTMKNVMGEIMVNIRPTLFLKKY